MSTPQVRRRMTLPSGGYLDWSGPREVSPETLEAMKTLGEAALAAMRKSDAYGEVRFEVRCNAPALLTEEANALCVLAEIEPGRVTVPMLVRLEQRGFIRRWPDGAVSLTDAGRDLMVAWLDEEQAKA